MKIHELKARLRPYYKDYVNDVRLSKLANPEGKATSVIRDGIRQSLVLPVEDALPFEEWATTLITDYARLLLQKVAQQQISGNVSPVEQLVNEQTIEFYLQLIEDSKK
jgi:hypothetical protein